MTFHSASFPLSHAWGPLASRPPNSTITPPFVHSHHILIDPEDGPEPPPLRSGSPRAATKSFPVLFVDTDMDLGSCEKVMVRGRLGYLANVGAVFNLVFCDVGGEELADSSSWDEL